MDHSLERLKGFGALRGLTGPDQQVLRTHRSRGRGPGPEAAGWSQANGSAFLRHGFLLAQWGAPLEATVFHR